jgi:hypothetical protein
MLFFAYLVVDAVAMEALVLAAREVAEATYVVLTAARRVGRWRCRRGRGFSTWLGVFRKLLQARHCDGAVREARDWRGYRFGRHGSGLQAGWWVRPGP